MSLHCPRCDVTFEKDLVRCPGCGWDFRAHRIPDGFLKRPLDLAPLKEFGLFLARDGLLIWVNGITVQVLWTIVAWIIHRVSSVALHLLAPEESMLQLEVFMVVLSLILATILFVPILSYYLFGLLRRHRYQVSVAYFNVLVPVGRSRYRESMAWALPCLMAGAVLLATFVVPGIVCLMVFVPLLLLIHLDKRNISGRRKAFILFLTFRRLWLLFLAIGVAMSAYWLGIGFLAYHWFWAGVVTAAIVVPAQSAFAVLLYESLLGRVNLDVDY